MCTYVYICIQNSVFFLIHLVTVESKINVCHEISVVSLEILLEEISYNTFYLHATEAHTSIKQKLIFLQNDC